MKPVMLKVPAGNHPVEVQPPQATRKEHPFQGFIDFQGIKIDVENLKGSTRKGKNPDGTPWSTKMLHHYGEIRGTEGTDGDKLDVYVGPNHDSSLVVVVNQNDPDTGDFDEQKVMLGWNTAAEAVAAYKKQYDSPGFYGSHFEMPIGAFWRWVHDDENRGEKVDQAVKGFVHEESSGPRGGHRIGFYQGPQGPVYVYGQPGHPYVGDMPKPEDEEAGHTEDEKQRYTAWFQRVRDLDDAGLKAEAEKMEAFGAKEGVPEHHKVLAAHALKVLQRMQEERVHPKPVEDHDAAWLGAIDDAKAEHEAGAALLAVHDKIRAGKQASQSPQAAPEAEEKVSGPQGPPPVSLSTDDGLQRWVDALASQPADKLGAVRDRMEAWTHADDRPEVRDRAVQAVAELDREAKRRAAPETPVVREEPAKVAPPPPAARPKEPRPPKAPKPVPEEPEDEKPTEARQKLVAAGYGDVGAKLEGSKKELAALRAQYADDKTKSVSLHDLDHLEHDATLARALVTRTRQFAGTKQEFADRLRTSGVSAGCAWWQTNMMSLIAERPDDTPAARANYVAGINRLQEAMSTWRTFKDCQQGIDALRDEATGFYFTAEEHQEYWDATRGANRAMQKSQDYASSAATQERIGAGKYSDWNRDESKRQAELARHLTKRALEIEEKARSEGRTAPRDILLALGRPFQLLALGMNDGKWEHKELADVAKKWTQWQRKANGFEYRNDWSWSVAKVREAKPEGEGPSDDIGQGRRIKYEREVPDTVERIGGAAHTFKADGINAAFGFRGVQYGNWMDEAATLAHTQHAGEALEDFADVLGLDRKKMGFSGRLGLAFGARGGGKAGAHFEAGRNVINLTKTRGGGALAHEWAHALDFLLAHTSFSEKSHHTSAVTTDCAWGAGAGDAMPEAVKTAWGKVRKAIYEGDHVPWNEVRADPSPDKALVAATKWPSVDALLAKAGGDPQKAVDNYLATYRVSTGQMKKLAQYLADKTGKRLSAKVPMKRGAKGSSMFVASALTIDGCKPNAYWHRPHELFARAFEAFVQDELETQKRRNTYLVWGTAVGNGGMGDATTAGGAPLHCYPRGEERTRINAAMRELMGALKDTGTIYKALDLLFAGKVLRA